MTNTYGFTRVHYVIVMLSEVFRSVSFLLLLLFHLSVTNGSSRAQIWTAHLTDRDTNHYAISPPLQKCGKQLKGVDTRPQYKFVL